MNFVKELGTIAITHIFLFSFLLTFFVGISFLAQNYVGEGSGFMSGIGGGPEEIAVDPKKETQPPLEDILSVSKADDTSHVGRNMRLNNIKVNEVLSDRAFVVGENQTDDLLVVLDAEGSPVESKSFISLLKSGQSVAVFGILQKFPSRNDLEKKMHISQKDMDNVKNQKMYLLAKGVLLFDDRMNPQGNTY